MLDKNITERLFRQHYHRMHRLACGMLGSDSAADDIVQDIFLRLIEADILPEEAKMESYLLTAVHHRCLNTLHHLTIRQRVMGLYPIADEPAIWSSDLQTERLETIRNCIAAMDEPHRSILRLRFDEDLTLRETAAQLQMNINTCYKYLMQAIEHIRKKCKPQKTF